MRKSLLLSTFLKSRVLANISNQLAQQQSPVVATGDPPANSEPLERKDRAMTDTATTSPKPRPLYLDVQATTPMVVDLTRMYFLR